MKAFLSTVCAVCMVIALLAFSVVQFYAGYLGIEHHLGTGFAILAIALAILLRFTLPVTIGAFFGALDVWHWHWGLALLFAAPGLLLIIPGVLSALVDKVRR